MNLDTPKIVDYGLTDFALAMPDRYKDPADPVVSYRSYYIGEKSVFAKWTKRETPHWFSGSNEISQPRNPPQTRNTQAHL